VSRFDRKKLRQSWGKIESLSEVIFLWDGDKLPFFEIPLSISPDMGRVLQTPEVVRIRAAVIALLTQPTTAVLASISSA
jgi:hypothetical protein